MHVPKRLRDVDRDDAAMRTYDYDDGSVLVVDFGTAAGGGSVDVLDGTAIVVTGDDQYEFDLPAEASDVSMNNGVLTIAE